MVSKMSDYFLFEVIVDNGLKGTQFVLHGNEIFPLLDFHKRQAVISMRGKKSTIMSGFKISHIHEKEIQQYHRGMPEGVALLREKNKRYGQSHIIPVIGKVNIGKYAGLEFSFFGCADIPRFFSQGVISLVINGRTEQHKGCTFRTATHKEAIPMHGNFTEEVETDLRQYTTVIKPVVAVPMRGKYKDIEYPLFSSNKVNEYFNPALVRSVASGHKTSYMGFIFISVDYDYIKGNTNTLSQEIFNATVDALKIPLIGTILKGPLAGIEFGIVKKSVLEQALTLRLVQAVIRGDRKSYKGCTFRSASFDEASELVKGYNSDVREYLQSK